MRTLEVILLITNVLALVLVVMARLIRGLKPYDKPVWAAGAGVNILVLALHAIIDSVRVPMALSYLFVVVFTVFAVIRTVRQRTGKKPRLWLGILKGVGASLADSLTMARTHAKDNLPLSGAQPRYPVVLFSQGYGVPSEFYTAQYEELASHGYIVVAIDHTYLAQASLLPSGIVTMTEATNKKATDDPDFIVRSSQTMADDASYVIDVLTEMNNGSRDTIFTHHLDMDRLGMMGHSLGGSAAYNLALNDHRVKAAASRRPSIWTERCSFHPRPG